VNKRGTPWVVEFKPRGSPCISPGVYPSRRTTEGHHGPPLSLLGAFRPSTLAPPRDSLSIRTRRAWPVNPDLMRWTTNAAIWAIFGTLGALAAFLVVGWSVVLWRKARRPVNIGRRP
jgi:hypothetical protein